MSESPSKRARTEEPEESSSDEDDAIELPDWDEFTNDARNELAKAVCGEDAADELTVNELRVMPVAELVNVEAVQAYVTECNEKRAAEAKRKRDEQKAAEKEKQARMMVHVVGVLDGFIDEAMGSVVDVDETHELTSEAGYGFDGTELSIMFKVEFTRKKTGRLHHVELDATVCISVDADGGVVYAYEEHDASEDIFERDCVWQDEIQVAIIRDLCTVFGVNKKVAKFIAREYVDKRDLERARDAPSSPDRHALADATDATEAQCQ